jgi:hypothetical protein
MFVDEAHDTSGFVRRIAALLGFASSFNVADSKIGNATLELLCDILKLDVAKPETMRMSDTQLKRRIVEQMTADYSRGDIVNIHGWWISHTESRCLDFVTSLTGPGTVRA